MTTTKIRAGATHYLAGVSRGASGECAHCGRPLKNLFRIRNEEGTEIIVGRVHCKQYTGWTPSIAEAEAAERCTRRDAAYAAYLTRSAAGRELDAAADAEVARQRKQHAALETRLGRRCEYPYPGVLAVTRQDIAEKLARGWWPDAECDYWARTGLATAARHARG